MTERTTPITVHLTDEQMDSIEHWPRPRSHYRAIQDAVKAQRPRPITVGDRVYIGQGAGFIYKVKAVEDGWAWLWTDQHAGPTSAAVHHLTRVDDEAQP